MNGQLNPITRKRVYELIYKTQRISKQDIAYQLTLSLPTVSQQLQSLEASGLIERNGSFASTGGRKAQIISCIYEDGFPSELKSVFIRFPWQLLT